MQQIFTQLSVLAVLTGVSVAVIQYLFSNHQIHLKDFISSLKKISFDETNEYDSELERQWESALTNCKQHTYFLNPNESILIGFIIIICLVGIYILALNPFSYFFDVSPNWLHWFIVLISVILFSWLIVNIRTLNQIFKKEDSIKSEFHDIEKQHQLVDKILNKDT
jgi:amino acid transporter